MENFETENIMNEEVVSPQGTEDITGEAVPPQGEQNSNDMTDEEFDQYVEELKKGNVRKEEPAVTQPTEVQEDEPFRSFQTEEDFQQFMDKTVGKRLHGSKVIEEKYNAIIDSVRGLYPDQNPEDAISKMVADAKRQAAEESGKTVEEIEEENSLRADAEAYRQIKRQEQEKNQRMDDIQKKWEQEEAQMKQVIPDFDFEKAMENEVFKSAILDEKLSISTAYLKALNGAPVQKKKERVFEIASGSGRGVEMGRVDPTQMNDKDFDKYIRGILEE